MRIDVKVGKFDYWKGMRHEVAVFPNSVAIFPGQSTSILLRNSDEEPSGIAAELRAENGALLYHGGDRYLMSSVKHVPLVGLSKILPLKAGVYSYRGSDGLVGKFFIEGIDKQVHLPNSLGGRALIYATFNNDGGTVETMEEL